ncbi:MAG: DUF3596 domain-containing protein [Burkholderiales bacterium]|nr:DUF3596 domain-containing protein [Burkholderiales bacterium]
MGAAGGVEVREKSIRVNFTYQGKSRKETIVTNGEPLPPTPANIKYAYRLAAEIKEKIKHGTFVYADYFPASKLATTGKPKTVGEHLYGHPRSDAIEWAKEDKFDSEKEKARLLIAVMREHIRARYGIKE